MNQRIKRPIILFGDSVIDNSSYIRDGELDTVAWIEQCFNDVVSHAVDGYKITDVTESINRDWSNNSNAEISILVSAGGNDLLSYANNDALLRGIDEPDMGCSLVSQDNMGMQSSLIRLDNREHQVVTNTLVNLSEILSDFEGAYASMLSTLLDASFVPAHIWLCTIYDMKFPPGLAERKEIEAHYRFPVALANGIIYNLAMGYGMRVLDLNKLAKDSGEKFYSNPIEPSSYGSMRIAHNLLHQLAPELIS